MNRNKPQSTTKAPRVAMSIVLDKSLANWIEAQASEHKRARCREVEVLLEEAKRRAESGVAA